MHADGRVWRRGRNRRSVSGDYSGRLRPRRASASLPLLFGFLAAATAFQNPHQLNNAARRLNPLCAGRSQDDHSPRRQKGVGHSLPLLLVAAVLFGDAPVAVPMTLPSSATPLLTHAVSPGPIYEDAYRDYTGLTSFILGSDAGDFVEDVQSSNDVPKDSRRSKSTDEVSVSASPDDLKDESTANQSQQTERPKTSVRVDDIGRVVKENKVEVELVCSDDDRPEVQATAPVVKIDRDQFRKIKVYQPPFLRYLPSSVQPLISKQLSSISVLKEIPNDQLFVASVLAGSLTEAVRTAMLYPLATVKARVQARKSRSARTKRSLPRKVKLTCLSLFFEVKKGSLYDGLLPTLLVTVPASGVYSGTKEVSRRALSAFIHYQIFQTFLSQGDNEAISIVFINLLAAFFADVAALAIRTPADVLSLRRQVFGRDNVQSDFSSWLGDSLALLPGTLAMRAKSCQQSMKLNFTTSLAMILTDIPYLMSRIFLNAAVTSSGENLGEYEVQTIAVACLCAFLSTPFDVARTRILLPKLASDEGTKRRLTSSSETQVLATMKRVYVEGEGGLPNLFSGWVERTAYLGLGRAWLDPLRVIGTTGLRDAILLKLFD